MTSITPLGAPGLYTWTPRRFGDQRGYFVETFNAGFMEKHGLPTGFVQDNLSLSSDVGVLRGLHCQLPPFAQAKLVRVARGRVFDVVVDIRKGSPVYGKWVGIELTAEKGEVLFVPRGFLHGFVTLEPMTEVQYKVDAPYSPQHDRTVLWSDPVLDIAWPLSGTPELSAKDAAGVSLANLDNTFVFDAQPERKQ